MPKTEGPEKPGRKKSKVVVETTTRRLRVVEARIPTSTLIDLVRAHADVKDSARVEDVPLPANNANIQVAVKTYARTFPLSLSGDTEEDPECVVLSWNLEEDAAPRRRRRAQPAEDRSERGHDDEEEPPEG